MKKILLILILLLGFHSLAWADDVSDFEISGMSVGDSLLEFFSEKEIKDEIKNANFYPKSKKFMIISLVPENVTHYENINFHIKSKDKKYIIYSVKGLVEMETKECLNLKKNAVKEIEKLIPSAKLSKHTNDYNKSMGASKAYINDYFISGGVIRAFCTDWDIEFLKKTENLIYANTLSINASSDELVDWIKNKAY